MKSDRDQLLFSVTKKDFDVQYYARSKGAGGQKLNKTNSAVRIRHKDSGACGRCSDHRKQAHNRKEAFNRLIELKNLK